MSDPRIEADPAASAPGAPAEPDPALTAAELARVAGIGALVTDADALLGVDRADSPSAARIDGGAGEDDDGGPFVTLGRDEWARLRESTPMTLTDEEVGRLGGLTDPIDSGEAEQIYLPLSRLLSLHVAGVSSLHQVTSTFLGRREARTPFVIGVAGSVAVGKSTTARVLRELLLRWPESPRVELVTTDGFLYPNAVLEERNLMQRKGFPESYDRRALLRFVADVKSGVPEVRAPRYDHLTYDILPGDGIVVHHPDVLIIEGLNVLQPSKGSDDPSGALTVSDYFDFSIYVDAEPADVQRWYVERFLSLRRTAFADPESFFHRFSVLTDDQAVELATGIWKTINEPNLLENIQPTRGRANLVLHKGRDHAVETIRLRKL